MGAVCYRSRDNAKSRAAGVCCSSNQDDAGSLSFKLVDPKLIQQSICSRNTIFASAPFTILGRKIDNSLSTKLFGFAFYAEDALFALSRLNRASHCFL